MSDVAVMAVDFGPQGVPPWSGVAVWAPGTDYTNVAPASAVQHDGSLYLCAITHHSGTDFFADRDAGKWTLTVSATLGEEGTIAVDAAVQAAADAEAALAAVPGTVQTAMLVMPTAQTVQSSVPLSRPAVVRDILERSLDPELFDDIGISAARDTAAIQAVVNRGRQVYFRDSTKYTINAPIRPLDGKSLVLFGDTGRENGPILQRADGYFGFMLQPKLSYVVDGLRILGNNSSGAIEDGTFAIGNDENSGAGNAKLHNCYIYGFEMPIYWGPSFQHPFGASYLNNMIQGGRSGLMCFAGDSGGATQGESNWSFVGTTLSNGLIKSGIPAAGQSWTDNSPDSTHDTITWSDTTPMYGWILVRRKRDLSIGWHVPPDWVSTHFSGSSYVAKKASGELWDYMVLRQTKAAKFRRCNGLALDGLQADYCGIGIDVDNCRGFDIGNLYTENQQPTVGNNPTPNLASIVVNGSIGSIGNIDAYNYTYLFMITGNGKLRQSGSNYGVNCFSWGMQTGATSQVLEHGPLIPSGATPILGSDFNAPTGGASEHGYMGTRIDPSTTKLSRYMDGVVLPSLDFYRRGGWRGGIGGDGQATEEIKISMERAQFQRTGKALQGVIVTKALTTALTNNVATPIATFDVGASNTHLSFLLHYHVYVASSGVLYQGRAGLLAVVLINASGSLAAGATPYEAAAVQSGTLPALTFSFTVAGNIATLKVLANSSISTPTPFCMLSDPLGLAGGASPTLTQL